jgi:hypothetical protein
MKILLAWLAFASTVVAQCPAPPVYSNPVYSTNHGNTVIVEKQAYVAQFVPFVVNVPTYSTTYVPGLQPAPLVPGATPIAQPGIPAQTQGFQTQGIEQRLISILDRLDQRLGAPAQGQQFQAQAQGFGGHEQAMVKNCSMCHDKHDNAAQGKGFLITDGQQLYAGLTGDDWNKITSATYNKEMPPNKPLSDEDLGHIMAVLKARVKKK